ncbi:MBL fold metallo-hydrolase [Kovacikia minuta CCNUW1]|uniref:MBL fold metallo-hydrolase n=1 Tax=Kovacikia minuta TaxID=2931930 RepID=UPI001CCE4046|nr:MBL fold metallo-hydrolase [Kovacikia minuta]UBF29023.1 MBL fold metallo-hydrolase [Kovacikia minuta CCNUW1]
MTELECLAYGVEQVDEGVCLLVRLGPYRIMLDCGLADISLLTAKKSSAPADLVLCSHAHADHARGLLALNQAFPQIPIYASEVTAQLLPLNWSGQTAQLPPRLCQALPWRTPVEFLDGLSATLYPAGHLPGAAAILLTYTAPTSNHEPARTYQVFYTGDFFLSNARLVEGLPLEELRGMAPDVLIVEGSYGTARHPRRRQQENQLAERINRAIATQRSILLPTPPLGLAQELLMLLRSHHHFTGRDLDIWVDPTVATGCDAYLGILPHLPPSVQNFARHQPLFWDERVRPRVRRLSRDRSLPPSFPCIVLADETADLSQYYEPKPDNWLVLVPQQPHRTSPALTQIDRRAAEKFSPPPNADTYLLAQHCDGPGTTQLIHNLRPQHVVFVHGSSTYLADLTGLEELHNRYHLHSPAAGSLVELPIGETFLQPAAPPETNYEGELTELDTVVTITLPNAITGDPRWQTLADTGLIEARWQGDELVLRGLPQRELLRQGSDRLLDWVDANSPLRQCCANCTHYRSQRCWNPASPLFEFKVTPEGFCPVFEPIQPQPEE